MNLLMEIPLYVYIRCPHFLNAWPVTKQLACVTLGIIDDKDIQLRQVNDQ